MHQPSQQQPPPNAPDACWHVDKGRETGPTAAPAMPTSFGTIDPEALVRLGRALQQSGYRFTTVTPATHARVNARSGNEWASGVEGVFGWSRPFREDVLPPALFALMKAAGVAVPAKDGWRSLVRLSSRGNQCWFHSAYPTSDKDAVFFGPDTYRFASALERHLARGMPVRRAVDIGCGAGVGAIVIAGMHPDARVIGGDINPVALEFTAVNAVLAATANVSVCRSDLLSAVDGEFDLIVSNPPYLLDPSERAYRHGGGGLGEGLSLAIVDTALERLAPGGTLLLYTGVAIVEGVDAFRAAIAARLTGVEWEYEELDPDVFGEELSSPPYQRADRIAAVIATVKKA